MPTKFQLKNGLKVLLVESNKSPVVSVQMWVKTGSADEKKGEEGISHFIEHLLFKGTRKFAVGEIAKTVEGSGGELNAYTSFDQTVYYVTIASRMADTALEVIDEMLNYPAFDPKEIELEKEVVIEEIKRSLDSPSRQASRLLFSTLYKKHPYGIPVIGYAENIRSVTAEKIRDFFRKRYTPMNMTLVVTGDFKAGEMKKKVVERFSKAPRLKLHKVKRATEKRSVARTSVAKSKFQETYLYLAWPTPNAHHKDIAALDMLGLILGQGDSSRLVKTIKNEKHLVNSIGASCYSPHDPGFFAISATLNDANIEAYLEQLGNELEAFFVSGPTHAEVSKAILNIESDKFYSLETVDGLSNLFGHFEFLYNDYRKFNSVLQAMQKIGPKELLKIARKYLTAKNMSVSCLTPGDEEKIKKQIEKFRARLKKISKLRSKLESGVKVKKTRIKWNAPRAGKRDTFERIILDNGARLLICERKDSPVVNVRAGFLGGLRYEHPRQAGVNELLSRAWTTGTQLKTEDQINSELESMAAHVSAFGGRNSLGLTMTSLAPFAEKAFALWSELLSLPRFEALAIEREKRLMAESLRVRQDNPAQKCMLNMSREIFGAHPYGRDPLGTSETLKELTNEHVREFYGQVVSSQNLVVAAIGDFSKKSWTKTIEHALEQLSRKPVSAPPLEKPYLQENRQVFEELKKEQSHIALAVPGITLLDASRYALDVMQAILSGQGGRLFVELRDKMSLAYSVSPIRLDGIDGGYFGAYIGCSPEKATKAVSMMRQELQRLANEKVTPTELESAKKYLIGRNAISNQKGSSLTSLVLFDELYGLPEGEYLKYAEKISAVTSEDIMELAKKLFSQKEVLSLVGPENVSL